MSYLFLLIGVIFGFAADRYIIEILDLMLEKFTNNKQYEACEVKYDISQIANLMAIETLEVEHEGLLIQKDMYDIKMSMSKQDANLIGFNMGETEAVEMEDDCDECDDYDCDECDKSPLSGSKVEMKYDGKIGF